MFAKSLGVNGFPEEATNPATCGTVTGASAGRCRPAGCGGVLDGETGSHVDNVVVHADLVGAT